MARVTRNGFLPTPERFGASAASADSGDQLQAWINYLVANKLIGEWPGVTYKSSKSLVANGDLAIICKPGAGLDISAGPNGVSPPLTSAVIALTCQGTVSAAIPLIGPLAKGDIILPCAPGDEALFPIDALVKVAGSMKFDPARSRSGKGEFVRVAGNSVSGQVTLRTALKDNYNATNPTDCYDDDAAPIAAYIVTPATLKISGGLRIIGSGGSTHSQQGIIAKYTSGSIIQDVTCDGVSALNYSLQNAIDSYIIDCKTFRAMHPVVGYMISLSQVTQNCHVLRGRGENCRHVFTTGSSVGSYKQDPVTGMRVNGTGGKPIWRGNHEGGVARDFTVTGLVGYGVRNDCFDTHGNCDNGAFIDCVSYNAGGQAFNTEGASMRLIRPVAKGALLGGISLTSGAMDTKASFYVEDPVIENCLGVGLSFGTAPHPDYPLRLDHDSDPNTPAIDVDFIVQPEPAGIASVVVINPQLKDIASTALRCIKPSDGTPGTASSFLNRPESFKVMGGTIDNCGTTLVMQLDFVDSYEVEGIKFRNIPAAAKAIGMSNCKDGSVKNNKMTYVSGATNAVIGTDNCTRVTVSGTKVTAPSAVSLRGFSFGGTCTGIRGYDNDFTDCNTFSTINTLVPVAGVVTVPAVIAGLMYRLGDNASAYDVRTVNGLHAGDRITFAGTGASGPVTIKQRVSGADNILMNGSADIVLDATTDTITFEWERLGARLVEAGRFVA